MPSRTSPATASSTTRVRARNTSSIAAASGDKGKGCDTFGPVGPWLVTRDEVPDPQALPMWLDVNGQRFQTAARRR
jgi:2-keto-4-pentenoate hydratase/2-oxohepta-3-ene-1,7-dioic acid hydratase in catechol pathway